MVDDSYNVIIFIIEARNLKCSEMTRCDRLDIINILVSSSQY